MQEIKDKIKIAVAGVACISTIAAPVQGHPEYVPEIINNFLVDRRKIIPEDVMKKGWMPSREKPIIIFCQNSSWNGFIDAGAGRLYVPKRLSQFAETYYTQQ